MPIDLWRGNLDFFLFSYLVVCLVLPFPACWFSWQLWHHLARAAARPPGAAVGTAWGHGAGVSAGLSRMAAACQGLRAPAAGLRAAVGETSPNNSNGTEPPPSPRAALGRVGPGRAGPGAGRASAAATPPRNELISMSAPPATVRKSAGPGSVPMRPGLPRSPR